MNLFVFREFQKMTLDVITSTAFGLDTDTVRQGDSLWLRKVKNVFDPSPKKVSVFRKIFQTVVSKF